MPKLSSSTILGHLTVLGITIADLSQCFTLDDEWAFIKKHHFNHIKVCHPDKGGDADTFRSVNDSFNVLRELVSKKQVTRFASDSSRATAREPVSGSASHGDYAPWEWYEESLVDFVPYIVSSQTCSLHSFQLPTLFRSSRPSQIAPSATKRPKKTHALTVAKYLRATFESDPGMRMLVATLGTFIWNVGESRRKCGLPSAHPLTANGFDPQCI
jgi:hypothetical protein